MDHYCHEDWGGICNHYLRTLIKSQLEITEWEITGALHVGPLKQCCQAEIQLESYAMLSFLVIIFFKVKNKKMTLMLITFYFIHEAKNSNFNVQSTWNYLWDILLFYLNAVPWEASVEFLYTARLSLDARFSMIRVKHKPKHWSFV